MKRKKNRVVASKKLKQRCALASECPEKYLIVAIILRAFLDLNSKNKNIAKAAKFWIQADESTEPFSYRWCIEQILEKEIEGHMKDFKKLLTFCPTQVILNLNLENDKSPVGDLSDLDDHQELQTVEDNYNKLQNED